MQIEVCMLTLIKKLKRKVLNLKLEKILEYENIFAWGFASNWSEEVFVIKKIKNNVPRTYVINNLNG